ncbi:unnamed protein product [Arctia plantaginis]|uniref:eIF-4F 25 kDa subunit n=1 Tax=Arctia plantaginis TaxID=874455 RepID=A0A8S1A8G7_ARCPL|nr:unnamed protein product [Arctia plantaginis]
MIISSEQKHPLENEWSFWMYTNKEKEWTANLVELTTFNTVEDYWCLYHHMKLPSELNTGQDYAIFKKGIKPMWEDESNQKGGRWQILFDDLQYHVLDAIWLDTVLLLIGENFKNADIICGVVVNVRQKNKISIWTNSFNSSAALEIGRKLKTQLRVPNKIHYYKHNTSKSMYNV